MSQKNIIPYKDRTIDLDKPVEVYKNIHKNLYSIRQNGKVVGHTNKILLKNCSFIVHQRGREQVVRTKRKMVHAWVKGYVTDSAIGVFTIPRIIYILPARIKYNPYRWDSFICDNLTNHYFMVKSARVVQLDENGMTGAYLNV